MLHTFDLFILIFYFAGILSLGLYLGRYVKSSEDFFLGGKMLPWWAIGMGIVVSDIGATDFIGLSGGAYRYGIVMANFDWVAGVLPLILAAFIFVPYYWRAGVYTVPEYLGRRYNIYVQSVQSLLWGAFMACNIGLLMWATGLLLSEVLGWDTMNSIYLTAALVALYVYKGGLIAITMNDVIHLVVMFVGGSAVLAMGLWTVGGWGAMVDQINAMGPEYQNHLDLMLPETTKSPYSWSAILLGLALVQGPAYWFSNQVVIQKTLGARTEWDAKAGMMLAAMIKAVIPFIMVIPGLVALCLIPGLEDGDKAFPRLIAEVLPPGLLGLVAAAFFAGLLSSVDAHVSSASTMWTKDVYQRFFVRNRPESHYLFVGRILTLFFIVFGVVFAPISQQFDGLYAAMQTFMSVILGPTLGILLLGIFTVRATSAGGLAGLLGGVATSIALHIYREAFFTIGEPFLYISFLSCMVSVIITILVSAVTSPKRADELHGLVYNLVMHDDEAQRILRDRAAG